MSKIKVNSLEGVGASTPAISIDNTSGACTANLTSIGGSHLSNRNKVINGAMNVSQRIGTTIQTGLTGNVSAYYIDRFRLELDNLGTWSLSQSTDSPDGFANSLKLDCTTADGSPASSDLLMISHRFEGQDLQDLQKGTSGAKKVVVSFYVKSTKTGTFVVELVDKDNSSRHINKTYTVSNTNWNRYTIEFAGDTTGVLGNDNTRSIDLNFWLGGGSNYTSGTLQTSWGADTNANRYVGGTNLADSTSNEFYITGVQFEVSDMGVATDFEHRSYGLELDLCKRYYQQYGIDSFGNNTKRLSLPFINEAASNTGGYINFRFEREMRGTPTATIGSTLELGEPQVDRGSYVVSSFNSLHAQGSDFFQFSGGQLGSEGNSNRYIRFGHDANAFAKFSAEL
jgi:hypothetical protein